MGDSIVLRDSKLPRVFRRAKFSASKTDKPQPCPDEIDSLPELVDFNAKYNPSHTFCVQCNTSEPTARLSFSDLKSATDRCREWLLEQPCLLKREANDRSPVAIFLESDIRIFIFLVGFLRAGIPCLLLSVRLSEAAAKHLLKTTRASNIVVSVKTCAALNLDHDQDGPQRLIAPPLGYFLNSASRELVPASSTFEFSDGSCDDLIFHSSGTTGLPKPIYLAHRYLLGYAACHEFSPDIDESITGKTLTTLPLYHGFGLLAPCLALSIGKPFVLTPSASIPNASLICSILSQYAITSMMTVPSVLEEYTTLTNDTFKHIKDLEFIVVGGGPMKPSVAEDLLERGVKLLNHFGATEIGAIAPIFRPTPEYNYPWLVLRKDLPFDIHELGIDEEGRRLCKLVAYPFGWDEPFELQDSLELRSSNGALQVKILGRRDELIVLKTGEKVSPALWESTLMASPLIKTAVVFGESRFQLGVILEPSPQASTLNITQLIDEIWPLVETANSQADNHAKIESKASFILKPHGVILPRSDKGSIQRREVYNILSTQIDEVYRVLDQEFSSSMVSFLSAGDFDENLREVIFSFLPSYIQDSDWDQDTNFFELGMDSLQATRLHRVLRSFIYTQPHHQKHSSSYSSNLLYTYPTLRMLSTFLTTGVCCHPETRQSYMLDMFQELKVHPSRDEMTLGDGKVVVITGATGSLGANLVESLTNRTDILEVICLVREHQAKTQMAHFQDSLCQKGVILTEGQIAKIRLIRWSPGDDYLGITLEAYSFITRTATHIFHGAWPMNFSLSLLSLKSQVRVMADLITLGLECQKARPNTTPRLILASSIAVVGGNAKHLRGLVIPETVPEDPLTTVPMGYAEAKWVCEHLIEDARHHLSSKINCAIIRIGQISGSAKSGFWSPREHIPRMLQASQMLNYLPKLTGDASWLPADVAADAISEILLDDRTKHLLYHLENPIRQSWKDILSIIKQDHSFKNVSFIEFDRWLELAAAEGELLEDLRWFFEDYFLPMATGEVKLETLHSTGSSPTLRTSSAVSMSTLQLYLSAWKKLGVLKV